MLWWNDSIVAVNDTSQLVAYYTIDERSAVQFYLVGLMSPGTHGWRMTYMGRRIARVDMNYDHNDDGDNH